MTHYTPSPSSDSTSLSAATTLYSPAAALRDFVEYVQEVQETNWASWIDVGTGVAHLMVFAPEVGASADLRKVAHWMLDVLPEEELVPVVEEIADRASYYDARVLAFVDISTALAAR